MHHFAGYITIDNAARISGYSNLGAKKALLNLTHEKFLIANKVKHKKTQLYIFRISKLGREFISQYSEHEPGTKNYRAFNINNFRPATLNHEMLIQRLANQLAKQFDVTFFKAEIVGGKTDKKGIIIGGRRPDAQFVGHDMAGYLEVELTIKSRQRYRQIFEIFNQHQKTVYWAIPEKLVHRFDPILQQEMPEPYLDNHHIISISEDD